MRDDVRPKDAVGDSVRHWYDEHGWQRDAGTGLYNDTATFSGAGTGSAGAALYEAQSYRDLNGGFGTGRLFLDAASGPIAHAEYVPWSAGYKHRVCIDLSIVALREARARVGAHGIFINGDLTALPLRDGSIDGGVSAYTIQHIDSRQQLAALRELVRVLAPGGSFCIITGIEPPLRRWAFTLLRPLLRKHTYKHKQRVEALYYHAQTPAWWRSTLQGLGVQGELHTLRMLRMNEYKLLFGDSIRPVHWLRRIERACPRLTLALAESAVVLVTKGDRHVGAPREQVPAQD
ncbi:MAG: class I SAM-dependent methyltransferase [Geminicoccaceae bacterium]